MSDDKAQKGALHLNKGNFDETLKGAEGKPVLVDFFAEWCGPCKMAAPVIEEIADEYDEKAVIAKVDVDAEQELAGAHGVMSIPTVIVFVNGEEVDRKIGFAGKDGYVKMIEEAMEQ